MEKLFQDDDSKTYRFQCRCLSAEDAMDLTVSKADGEDELKVITDKCPEGKFHILCLDFIGTGLWSRIKYAWEILRGRWCWREFVVREADAKVLSDIFNPDIPFENLP